MLDFREMITVKQLAKELGFDPDTIRHWADKGLIPCYRNPINKYRMFNLREVRKVLDPDSSNSISSGSQVKELKP